MTESTSIPSSTVAASHEAEARIVKPLQFDDNTPEMVGMHRLAAVSHLLVGSQKLWAGVLMAEPNTSSGVHHHGPLETVVYLAEGRGTLRWGRRLEHETELEAGDFLFVPPYVPHQEINPSSDQPALWIVVRSGPEAVVVALTPDANGEYVAPGSDKSTGLHSGGNEDGKTPMSRIWLAAVAVVGLGVVAIDGLWVWSAARFWQVLLQVAILALLAVLGIGWARRSRAIRRLAVLDAYAEREINRSRHTLHG